MGRTKLSLQERCSAYPKEDGFFVHDKKSLMCRFCNVKLEWEKKDSLDKHLKSVKHVANKASAVASASSSKRQAGIAEMLDNAKKAKTENETLRYDIVKMCLKANIPLTKLDNVEVRSFLNKYIPGAGCIPSSDRLRREYVSKCSDEMKEDIKHAVKDVPIVIVADETCDKNGRCVFAVLFRTMTATSQQKVYLASCNFLDVANRSTCSQAIVDTLKDYNIKYENIVGLVSDSAAYMACCFDALKILIGDHLIHFKCWAHKINLVSDTFMKELKDLNFIVSKVKIAFLHSRKMKSAYLQFLEDKFPQLTKKLFPDPVITRWNSWFHAVQYLDTHLPAIIEFFTSFENKNASIELILDHLKNEATLDLVCLQCKFVSDTCASIVNLLTTLEGTTYPFAHLLWEELESIKLLLKRCSEGYFSAGIINCLDKIQNDTQKASARNCLKSAAVKSLQKLCKHTAPDPANIFYKNVGELFNPAVCGAKLCLNDSAVVNIARTIPQFQSISSDCFIEAYISFHRHLVECLRRNEKPDIVQLLLCERLKYEEFASAALSAIWGPVNSVDAERFFSTYSLVVSDKRRSMKSDTIETTSMLAYNK